MILRLQMSLASILGIVALFAAASPSPAQIETAVRPVKSMIVKAQTAAAVSYAGVVQPRVETDLAFRTLGHIVSRPVEVGDIVTKGQLIAEIDPLALQMAVTSAEANLNTAQARVDNATVNAWRKKTLAATKAASEADRDAAEQTLKSAEATLLEAQASYDKAREQLGYASLRAEFDGIVTATAAETGQVVTAGQAVVRMARLDERDAVIDVAEQDLGGLSIGCRYRVSLQLDPSVQVQGVLREIGPQADTNTRTYRVKIALEAPPDAFRFGSVVNAVAEDDARAAIITVPNRAVLRRDGATYVWAVNTNTHTVSLRAVRIAAIHLRSGAAAGSLGFERRR